MANQYEVLGKAPVEEDLKKLSSENVHLTIKGISAGYGKMDILNNFDLAVFNVVQESSVGFNSISYDTTYSSNPYWSSIDSDRHFFTEKSAKPFLMGQIPLFIASPGYVEQLRKLGFDLFDDIINHDYDKEDFILKRCNILYKELKRLSLQDLKNLNYIKYYYFYYFKHAKYCCLGIYHFLTK